MQADRHRKDEQEELGQVKRRQHTSRAEGILASDDVSGRGSILDAREMQLNSGTPYLSRGLTRSKETVKGA